MAKTLTFHAADKSGNLLSREGRTPDIKHADEVVIDPTEVIAVRSYGATPHTIGGATEYRHVRQVYMLDGSIQTIASGSSQKDQIPQDIRTLEALGGKPAVTLATVDGPVMTTSAFKGEWAGPITISTAPADQAYIFWEEVQSTATIKTGINGMFTATGQPQQLSEGTPLYSTHVTLAGNTLEVAHLERSRLDKIPEAVPGQAGPTAPRPQAAAALNA